MKKAVLLLTVLTLVALGAGASAGVRVGPKLGVNSSTWAGEDLQFDDPERRSGVAFGAFAQIDIDESIPLTIQPEILFVQKGADAMVEGSTMESKVKYVAVPVLAKLNIPLRGNVRPSLLIGPSFNFLTSAKRVFNDEEIDFKELTKNTELSIVVGGGVDITLPKWGMVTVDVRFDIGLSEVYSLVDPQVRNSSYGFTAGWGFDL